MKRKLIILITLLLFVFSSNSYAARSSLNIVMDKEKLKTSVPFPILYDENVLMPMQPVLKKLGYKVEINKEKDGSTSIVAIKGSFNFATYPGAYVTWVNGNKVETQSSIKSIKGIYYIPAKYLKEVLKLEIEVDKKSKTVKLSEVKRIPILPDDLAKNTKSVIKIRGNQASDYGYEVQGSGFVISTDGKIVTNYHVISDMRNIQFIFNGRTYSSNVKVLDYSKDKDIAILKIDEPNTVPVKLGDSNSMVKDDEVISVSSPNDGFNKVSTGKIQGLGYDDKVNLSYFAIDKIIDHGSSGGPLFNKYGEVIGINFAANDKYAFAIQINELNNLKQDKNLTLEEFLKLAEK